MAGLSDTLSHRIDALGLLPVQPRSAVRLIELSKDPDTDLNLYVTLIQADAALSSTLLRVTNSACVDSRQSARTIKQAVNLLGTSTVNAIAIGQSLAGMYSRYGLEEEDARAYWEASLCKAVAAQILARVAAPERAEEVFAISLFQDIGVGLFVATAYTEFAELLRDPRFTVRSQLRYEYARFGLNHAVVGRRLAHKLELPRLYADATEFHHDEHGLRSVVSNDDIFRALHTVSFLPHDVRSWKPEDILHFSFALRDLFPARWASASAFIHGVEPEFARLATMLSPHSATSTSLVELMNKAYHDNVRFAIPLAPHV